MYSVRWIKHKERQQLHGVFHPFELDLPNLALFLSFTKSKAQMPPSPPLSPSPQIPTIPNPQPQIPCVPFGTEIPIFCRSAGGHYLLQHLANKGLQEAVASYTREGCYSQSRTMWRLSPPPAVIVELAKGFLALDWAETGLTSQVVQNRIFVQPSARKR